ncbi:endonuclease III [Candidatus Babeliales bacterium]|nr:endonuclease III [Candidatus Babeliales bacterium]
MNIKALIFLLKDITKQSPEPMSREIVSLFGKDPYLILVSCLLSLQNRDSVTLPVSINLFRVIKTPQDLLALSRQELESYISSVNYYKTKAQRLYDVSYDIIHRFGGTVPSTKEELMSMRGVGLKTANLVLAEAFDVPAICVDTHVHRLSNHWGLVHTQTPEQTEIALQKIIPQKHWKSLNYWMVKWGQSICKRLPCKNSDCVRIQNIVTSQ